MNIICVICSDLLVPSNEIYYTRCGHVFHYECLIQWLERSKTCPQCREKVTHNKIHRLYFTFSNNDTIDENSATLQQRIDSLKFQILLKEKDINHYTSKNVTLVKQNAGLRQEVRKVENEISQKNSAIYALKEQTKYFKEQSLQCDNMKKEIVILKKKVEELTNIQILLNAPFNDVEEMVWRTKDSNTLLTYISVMKKELLINLDKRKQLRATIKKLQHELNKTAMQQVSVIEERAKQLDLEERLACSESEKISLQIKINELEEKLGVTKEVPNNDPIMQQIDDIQQKNENEVTKDYFAEKSLLTKTNTIRKSHKSLTSALENKERDVNNSLRSCKRSIREISKNSSQEIGIDQSTSLESSIGYCSLNNDSLIISKKQKLTRVNKQSNELSNVSMDDDYMALSTKNKKIKESTAKPKREKISKSSKNKTQMSVVDLT